MPILATNNLGGGILVFVFSAAAASLAALRFAALSVSTSFGAVFSPRVERSFATSLPSCGGNGMTSGVASLVDVVDGVEDEVCAGVVSAGLGEDDMGEEATVG